MIAGRLGLSTLASGRSWGIPTRVRDEISKREKLHRLNCHGPDHPIPSNSRRVSGPRLAVTQRICTAKQSATHVDTVSCESFAVFCAQLCCSRVVGYTCLSVFKTSETPSPGGQLRGDRQTECARFERNIGWWSGRSTSSCSRRELFSCAVQFRWCSCYNECAGDHARITTSGFRHGVWR